MTNTKGLRSTDFLVHPLHNHRTQAQSVWVCAATARDLQTEGMQRASVKRGSCMASTTFSTGSGQQLTTGETAELPWPPRWSIHVRRDGKAIRNLSRAFHLLESKGSKWDASITFKGRLEEGFLGGVGGAWGRGKHRGRERG